MRQLEFRKMHGIGNDFVVIDARATKIDLKIQEIQRIGDRHKGVGFDQLALIESDPQLDASVRFFNQDGGEAGACGNATRCVADLVGRDVGKTNIELRTIAGVLTSVLLQDGRVRVEMTEPRLNWSDIPLARYCDTLDVPIDHPELPRPVAVNMGNPHAVFFVEDADRIDAERLGMLMETHALFPERANIGFATIKSRQEIRLRVFERTAGLTLACGSGACAAHVAAYRRGLVDDQTRLILDGGELKIEWSGQGTVAMTGPVASSFCGQIDLDQLSE